METVTFAKAEEKGPQNPNTEHIEFIGQVNGEDVKVVIEPGALDEATAKTIQENGGFDYVEDQMQKAPEEK